MRRNNSNLTLPSPAVTSFVGRGFSGQAFTPTLAQRSERWREKTRGSGRILAIVLGFLLVGQAFRRIAFGVCTQSGTVGPSSTAIVGSNDIPGIEGRHYLLIQNSGTTNGMNVAIGTSNNATSKDFYLAPGASWIMTMQQLKMVPGGDVAAISSNGTSYSFCDW
jgi:hypothetical protein